MTTELHRGSAKIYDFPPRGRFAASGRFDGPASVLNLTAARVASLTTPGIAPVAFGSSWYHEEAIRDEQTRSD
jgi:hypothetical protein